MIPSIILPDFPCSLSFITLLKIETGKNKQKTHINTKEIEMTKNLNMKENPTGTFQ